MSVTEIRHAVNSPTATFLFDTLEKKKESERAYSVRIKSNRETMGLQEKKGTR